MILSIVSRQWFPPLRHQICIYKATPLRSKIGLSSLKHTTNHNTNESVAEKISNPTFDLSLGYNRLVYHSTAHQDDFHPIQVARLLRATGGDHSVGPQERAKYLNPMQNLFTDKELLKMQHDLAKMVDHHIVIWGNDLEEFLRGVPESLDHPDRYVKKLELWITQVSTQRAEARQPNIEIPGEWWTGWPHPCLGVAKEIQSRHTNSVRFHLHQADEVPNSVDDFFWEANVWQLDIPFVRVPFYTGFDHYWRIGHPSHFMSADQEQDLHYMTTKDMKTFHIKRVPWVASPTELGSLQWSQDRDLVLIHNFVFNPQSQQPYHPPGHFHPHPNGNFDDVESCKFILSLQDGSIDERSVRTFGS